MNPGNPFLVAVVVIVAALGLMSSAPGAQAVCAAIPLLAVYLLWPPGSLPLLLLPISIQWLQIVTKPVSAAVQGVPISYLSERGADLETGFLLACLGLVSLVIGLRIGFGAPPRTIAWNFREDLKRYREGDIYSLTLTCLGVGYVAEILAPFAGGARQVLLAVGDVKLAAIFLAVAWSVTTGRGRVFTSAVVAFEVGLGMMGFFGEFRETLMITVIALLAAAPRVRAGTMAGVAIVAFLALCLAVFWSAVKPEYRIFANRGSGQQVVDRTLSERVGYLMDAALKFDGAQTADGMDRLVRRIAYIDFFSHTLDGAAFSGNAGGEQTMSAIMHVLIPRLIYPDKPPLPNDTIVTARYTGLQFQPGEDSSISIGYQGELYADFGPFGSLLAIMVLGAIIGKCCSIVQRYPSGSLSINVSLSLLPLIPVMMFETALIKMFGALLTFLIAALLLQRYVLPYLLGSRFFKRATIAKGSRHR